MLGKNLVHTQNDFSVLVWDFISRVTLTLATLEAR